MNSISMFNCLNKIARPASQTQKFLMKKLRKFIKMQFKLFNNPNKNSKKSMELNLIICPL